MKLLESVTFVLPTQADTEELKFRKSKDESSAIPHCVQPIENENNFIQSSPIKQSEPVSFVLLAQADTEKSKFPENKDECKR